MPHAEGTNDDDEVVEGGGRARQGLRTWLPWGRGRGRAGLRRQPYRVAHNPNAVEPAERSPHGQNLDEQEQEQDQQQRLLFRLVGDLSFEVSS